MLVLSTPEQRITPPPYHFTTAVYAGLPSSLSLFFDYWCDASQETYNEIKTMVNKITPHDESNRYLMINRTVMKQYGDRYSIIECV
jgi:hypothetical protein